MGPRQRLFAAPALLALFAFSAQDPAQDPAQEPAPERLEVHLTVTGEEWTLDRADGRTLLVEPRGGTDPRSWRFALPDDVAGGIREARLGTWQTTDGVIPVLGLVVADGERSSVHVAMQLPPEREWRLSEPLVVTEDEPFRIAELLALGGDAIDMTLRRGRLDYARDTRPEVLVFTDSCAGVDSARALLDVSGGERLAIGARR